MVKTEELLNYEAPLVEVIQVEVEKGFATSNPSGTGDDMLWELTLNGFWI